MTIPRFIKKIGFRLLVINVVFFSVKYTLGHRDHNLLDPTHLFYYASAFLLFMVVWESNDYLIRRHTKKHSEHSLDLQSGIRIVVLNLAFAIPFCALVYYIPTFYFNDTLHIVESGETPSIKFWQDFSRASLLSFTVIVSNLFYYTLQQKKEMAHTIGQLQKELITTKYNSLKDQISPHFLFNSLNTLTSLMYEDRDLASDFVSRLASCYRYILEHSEDDLVSLDKEISFLDSFIFMMNVRHEEALQITTTITANPTDYLIPTLSLQMLVENALKHNYYSKETPLHIRIFTTAQHIVVENTVRERKPKEATTQLGIANIKKRYAFYTTAPVSVTHTATLFTIAIPLLSIRDKNVNLILTTKAHEHRTHRR